VGDDVYISLNYKLLKIYNIENEMIATHERSKSRGVFSSNAAHYDKYKVLCPGFEQHDELYEDKMRKIGDNSYAFYLEIEKSIIRKGKKAYQLEEKNTSCQ
jgi:hypothetical protein